MAIGTTMLRGAQRSDFADGVQGAVYEMLILFSLVASWLAWRVFVHGGGKKGWTWSWTKKTTAKTPITDKETRDAAFVPTLTPQRYRELDERSLRLLCEKAKDPASATRCASLILPLVSDHYSMALRLFRLMERTGNLRNLSDERLYFALLQAAVRVGHPEVTEEVLTLMKKYGVRPGGDFFRSTLKLLSSKRYYQQCLIVFKAFGGEGGGLLPSEKAVYSCIAVAAAELGEVQVAERCVELSRAAGLELTARDVATLLRTHSKRGSWKAAVAELQRIRQTGDTIDVVGVNVVLTACVNGKRPDVAYDILQDLRKGMVKGVLPDITSYNTVLKGHMQVQGGSSLMEKGFKVWEEMEEAGLEPDDASFTIILDGCIAEGDMYRANEVMDSIIRRGLAPNLLLCTTFLKGLVKANMLDAALNLYKAMWKGRSQSPSSSTAAVADPVVMKKASEETKKEGGEEHQEKSDDCHGQAVTAAAKKGPAPDIIVMSVLIKGCCDASRMETALEILGDMFAADIAPDDLVLNYFLEGCCHGGNCMLANKLFEELPQRGGFKPSAYSVSTMIKTFGKSGLMDDARRFLAEAKERHGLVPTVVTYTCLMSGYVRNKNTQGALEVFEEMKANGLQPDRMTYTTLIQGCTQGGLFTTALNLAEDMFRDAVDRRPTDDECLCALLQELLQRDEVDLGRQLYKLLARHGVKVSMSMMQKRW